MQTQTFEFDRGSNQSRIELPQRWIACLRRSGRFFRNLKGQVVFLISEPSELMVLSRAAELRGILECGDVIRISSPHLSDEDIRELWHVTNDYRWRLPCFERRYAAAQGGEVSAK
jgi:hypothetical protein